MKYEILPPLTKPKLYTTLPHIPPPHGSSGASQGWGEDGRGKKNKEIATGEVYTQLSAPYPNHARRLRLRSAAVTPHRLLRGPAQSRWLWLNRRWTLLMRRAVGQGWVRCVGVVFGNSCYLLLYEKRAVVCLKFEVR
ncbi:hypothetical protein JTE90_016703 [Oedothorax gibbosus]|uniref:Uncharacterized protein n=1 Tax=Oedothorax gibbosus TaxID=931172 RepID=A0AAV6V153_9ARAC|nr:hypothetical protein JTE90_016703 [Oedothorax gibbosus]